MKSVIQTSIYRSVWWSMMWTLKLIYIAGSLGIVPLTSLHTKNINQLYLLVIQYNLLVLGRKRQDCSLSDSHFH